MKDLVMLALTLLFFAVTWLYVRACERVVIPAERIGAGLPTVIGSTSDVTRSLRAPGSLPSFTRNVTAAGPR